MTSSTGPQLTGRLSDTSSLITLTHLPRSTRLDFCTSHHHLPRSQPSAPLETPSPLPHYTIALAPSLGPVTTKVMSILRLALNQLIGPSFEDIVVSCSKFEYESFFWGNSTEQVEC